MNRSPRLFLSHASADGPAAAAFAAELREKFDDQVSVYLSSDDRSLPPGQEWRDSVKANLLEADVLIVYCTPTSIERPWVNFELGAAFGAGKRIIPFCPTPLAPNAVPGPLDLLQHTSDPRACRREIGRALRLRHSLWLLLVGVSPREAFVAGLAMPDRHVVAATPGALPVDRLSDFDAVVFASDVPVTDIESDARGLRRLAPNLPIAAFLPAGTPAEALRGPGGPEVVDTPEDLITWLNDLPRHA